MTCHYICPDKGCTVLFVMVILALTI